MAGLHVEVAVDDAAAFVSSAILGFTAVLPDCTGVTGRCCDMRIDDGAEEGRDLCVGAELLGAEFLGGWGENAFFRCVALGDSRRA